MAHRVHLISTLSTQDYINLVANYYSIISNEKDENQALIDRGFSQEYIDSVTKNKKSKHVDIAGLRFKKSILQFKYHLLNYVLVLFDNYEKGNLPFAGTISEQPSQVIEIFSTIKNIRNEYQLAVEKQKSLPHKRKK